ncbi:AAA family ATPase [Sedimentitalea sp. HM32M-2]|uniref:AAA family ATPase n=1 Tax=Sedimentitalea sp. HM32M-2 TaxID=3351566 RepID=UPI00362B9A37
MYNSFFGFDIQPFKITPDPAFIYWNKQHRRAASILAFGIEQLVPITVVTGDVGTGKTTLLQQFLTEAPEDMTIGLISNFWSGMDGLYQWILNAYDLDTSGSEVAQFRRFQDFVVAEYAAGRRCVLIVDEAQNVSDEDLEQLRMLTNINAGKDSLLMLFLVGQPQLRDRLQQHNNRQIAQRVGAAFHLGAMSQEDSRDYIRHRLRVAGCTDEIFDEAALDQIHVAAGGVPRLINVICELALVAAYGDGIKRIDGAYLETFLQEAAESGMMAHLPMPLSRSDADPAVVTTDPGPAPGTGGKGRGTHRFRLVSGLPQFDSVLSTDTSAPEPVVASAEPDAVKPDAAPEPPPAQSKKATGEEEADEAQLLESLMARSLARWDTVAKRAAAEASEPAIGTEGKTDPQPPDPSPSASAPDEKATAAVAPLRLDATLATADPGPADASSDPGDGTDPAAMAEPASAAASPETGRRWGAGRRPLYAALLVLAAAGAYGVPRLLQSPHIPAGDAASGPVVPVRDSTDVATPEAAVEQAAKVAAVAAPAAKEPAPPSAEAPQRQAIETDPESSDDGAALLQQALSTLPTDPAAVVGFARAALRGQAQAAYYLGQIHESGVGVPRDLALARAWYELASPSVRSARRRLAALGAPEQGGELTAPRLLAASIAPDGGGEFVWSSGTGADPAVYVLELAPGADAPLRRLPPQALSALRLPDLGAAQMWRVVAADPATGRSAVSEWRGLGVVELPAPEGPTGLMPRVDLAVPAGMAEDRVAAVTEALGAAGIAFAARQSPATGGADNAIVIGYTYEADRMAAQRIAGLIGSDARAERVSASSPDSEVPLPGDITVTLAAPDRETRTD